MAKVLAGFLLLALLLGLHVQAGQSSIGASNAAQESVPTVLARGPYYRLWTTRTNALRGSATTNPSTAKHQIMELATGMHYWDGNQWAVSNPTFEVRNGGFAATQTQHKVLLNSNIFVTGAVNTTTPDGIVLHSTPLGIGLYDAASGNFLLIGEITNSAGIQVASNQVVYPNAFSGICANLVYTMKRGSFQQDVVFTGSVDPAAYGFPPATTRIQVITEFYGSPIPQVKQGVLQVEHDQAIRNQMVSPDLTDQTLLFGKFFLGRGHAFLTGTNLPGQPNIPPGAPVGKAFTQVEQRQFLIESVKYPSIWRELQSLPECNANGTASKGTIQKATTAYAALPILPKAIQNAAIDSKVRVSVDSTNGKPFAKNRPAVAKAAPAKLLAKGGADNKMNLLNGFVVDYVGLDDETYTGDYTFQSDTTYYVSGTFVCTGTMTLEGGAVIKFQGSCASNTWNNDASLQGVFNCAGSMYRPTILTASDDNTVGETMNSTIDPCYTGNPTNTYYGNGYLACTTQDLNNLRISFAGYGIYDGNQPVNAATWNNLQFVRCQASYYNPAGDYSITLNNCLFANGSGFYNYLGAQTYYLNQCTFDSMSLISWIDPALGAADTFYATNCIFASVTYDGSLSILDGGYNGFYNSTNFGSHVYTNSASPFQSVGAGNHYLANNCAFRNAGTTNIDTNLWAALQLRTTYPPIFFNGGTNSAEYTNNLTLYPQAQRETGDALDLGYHYDPIDYAFDQIFVTNATLTVTPGTVISALVTNGAGYGLLVTAGGQFLCQGSPVNRCWIVNFNTVQEQYTTSWLGAPDYGLFSPNFTGNPPGSLINCRFTDFSSLAQDAYFFYENCICSNTGTINCQDCQFHGGQISLVDPAMSLTNCLMEMVYSQLHSTNSSLPVIRNNLFYGGTFDFLPGVTNATVQDNVFYQTSIPTSLAGFGYNGGFNAFLTNCDRMLPTNSTDMVLTNISFEAGPLGYYYYPTTSLLINADTNKTADQVGLYHYTTTTNQVKETNSFLDIGYHYVALGTNGLPVDTTGCGTPDYLRDSNGNGLVDSGELSWTNAADLGLNVIITRPKNNSVIP